MAPPPAPFSAGCRPRVGVATPVATRRSAARGGGGRGARRRADGRAPVSPPPLTVRATPPPSLPPQEATRAVAWAASHLYRPGDALHILHVVPRAVATATPSGALFYAPPPPATAEADLACAAEAFIRDHFLAAAEVRGLPEGSVVVDIVHERACATSVAAAIVGAADDLDAAAVVLLAHGRTRVQELVWGSVSKAVQAASGRAVVLIK